VCVYTHKTTLISHEISGEMKLIFYCLIWVISGIIILFYATNPPVGQGPLIHEVTRPHTTGHHSQ
jgi:hypothetical protein